MIGFLLASVLFTAGEPHAAPELKWSRLPSLLDRHGFAGMFVGVSGGALICAGGANFPEKKPWEGGAKVWHDGVFALERP
ncbi:MAG TPA: galactose oxidase, partial [Planctomycetia bacterium]|nr:galactose oxidase [Planctomycetia bacterium]